MKYPVGLKADDIEELKKLQHQYPSVSMYFLERIYRYVKNNPEEAMRIESGELVLPEYDRSDPFISDEQKLKLREEYKNKLSMLIV